MVTLRPRKQRDLRATSRDEGGQTLLLKRAAEESLPETSLQKRARRARDRILARLPDIEQIKEELVDAIHDLDREYDRSRNRVFASSAFRPFFACLSDAKRDPEERSRVAEEGRPRVRIDLTFRTDIKWDCYDDSPKCEEQTPFFLAWMSRDPDDAQTAQEKNQATTSAASNLSDGSFRTPMRSSGFTDATTEEYEERHRPQLVFAAQGFRVTVDDTICRRMSTGFVHIHACYIPWDWCRGLSAEDRYRVQTRDRLRAMSRALAGAIGHSLMHKQMGGTGLSMAMTGECFSRVLAVSSDTVVLELSTTMRDARPNKSLRFLRSSSGGQRFILAHEFLNGSRTDLCWRREREDAIDTHAVAVFRDFCRLCVQLVGSVIRPNGLQTFGGNNIDLNGLLGGPGHTLDCAKPADLAQLYDILGEAPLEEVRAPMSAFKSEYASSGTRSRKDNIGPKDSTSNVGREDSFVIRTLQALQRCGTQVRVVTPEQMDLVLHELEKDTP